MINTDFILQNTVNIDSVFINDTTVVSLDEIQSVDNQYNDFRFVTESKVEKIEPRIREVTFISSAWNFMIVFIALIFIVINKFLSNNLSSTLLMPFSNSGIEKYLRDKQSSLNFASLSVVLTSILLISMFIQKVYIIYGANIILHDNFAFYIDVLTAVSAFFLFDYLAISFFSWLLNINTMPLLHHRLHISALAFCNLFLIFILMLIFFYPDKLFCILGFVFFAIIFTFRIVKFFVEIRFFSKVNFINIFLYLCAVEIIPILMISKMIFDIL